MTFGKINHIAIAVPDLEAATAFYAALPGVTVSKQTRQPDHGVTTVFVQFENIKIELLEPLGENSPILNFLKNQPAGGMHHICLETDELNKDSLKIAERGVRILGDGKPKIGAHGKPVVFLHPKDCFGTLIEFEQE